MLKEVALYNVPILPFSTRIPDGKLYFHFSQVLCFNHIFVSVIFLMMGSSHWSSKTLAGLIGFQPLQTKSSLQEPQQENSCRQKKLLEGKLFIGRGDRVQLLELTIREMTSISMVFP